MVSNKKIERWAIYIDIEGFRSAIETCESQAIQTLGYLMEGIFLIGKNSPNRINAHQIGDAFVIVSDFGSMSLKVPVAVAIVLLRHVAAHKWFAKASIGEGGFADITSCYPVSIRESRTSEGHVRMGRGVMTYFPVMGTALVNAYEIFKRSPRGALLTVASSNRGRLPDGCIVKELPGQVLSINWVGSQFPLVLQLQADSCLRTTTLDEINIAFSQYKKSNLDLSQDWAKDWVTNTSQLLELS